MQQNIMNKRLTIVATLMAALTLTTACSNRDPHRRGIEAGKAACECYKLEGLEAVQKCLDQIEKDNQELLTDTAYINAIESQLLECITDGVIDIEKPIKEKPSPKTTISDTVNNK